MIDPAGCANLIEMNPRVTPLCNIRGANHDMIRAAMQAWTGHSIAPAPPLATDLIAHFPLAWQCDRNDRRLAHCHQDIPRDDPALMQAMLLPLWPDRHWPARLLTWLRRPAGARATSEILTPSSFAQAPGEVAFDAEARAAL